MTPAPRSLLHTFPIRAGAHARRADGMCAMEMVAYLAGEDHDDGPACACPVLAAIVRAFNDALPSDEQRSRWLRQRIPRLVNSRRRAADEQARGLLIADYAVRVFAPLALAHAGQLDAARRIARLPAVLDRASALLAAGALQGLGCAVAPAAWLAARAAGPLPAHVWAAGVVRQARQAEAASAWPLLGELIDQLLATGMPAEALPVRGFAELA